MAFTIPDQAEIVKANLSDVPSLMEKEGLNFSSLAMAGVIKMDRMGIKYLVVN